MTRKFLPIAVLALLMCSVTARAELRMGANISSNSIAIGDTAIVEVNVAGLEQVNPPGIEVEEGDAAGIRAELDTGFTSRRMIVTNGVREDYVSFRFKVVGVKEGTYSLAATVAVDGETFATDAMELKVRPQTQAEKELEPTFKIVVEKSEIYVGEILPIQLGQRKSY